MSNQKKWDGKSFSGPAKNGANKWDGKSFAKADPPRMSGKNFKKIGSILALIALVVAGYFVFRPSKSGDELMDLYAETPLGEKEIPGGQKKASFLPREQLVLEWIDSGYITSSSKKLITITVTGRKGTVVKYEIMIHELRLGNGESWFMFPLSGPYSLAACKILGLDLPTKWMSEHLRRKAFEEGGKVWFIAAREIKKHLGELSTANKREWTLKGLGRRKGVTEGMTPKFIHTRGERLMVLLDVEEIDSSGPISGHFKEIIQDPVQARRNKLATYPGHGGKKLKKNWRLSVRGAYAADVHPIDFFDYSHGVRCAKGELEVKDEDDEEFKTMTIVEFYANEEYRKEFRLGLPLNETSYAYPPELQEWMEGHGYATE